MIGTDALLKCARAAIAAVALIATAAASETPKATAEYLKALGLKPDILNGLDAELAVPEEILAAARKEGALSIIGSWEPEDFRTLSAPFSERYPFIKISYNYGRAFNERAIKPLIAFKEGRYLSDIITGFGGSRRLFEKANAFEDLRSLPGFKNPTGGNDPNGGWMNIRNRYWCIAYNTKLIKADDLPKTWEELLTSKAFQDGKLGVANRPQLWLLPLWSEKGKDWIANYIERFFSEVKPQVRKEGLSALVTLVVAGEISAAIPADPARVKAFVEKGAPVSWHCPELIPRAISQIAVLKGSPNANAAKVFSNWMVSKEGQIAQFHAEGTSPSHRALQRVELLPFGDQIQGRKQVDEDETHLSELNTMWGKSWKRGGR